METAHAAIRLRRFPNGLAAMLLLLGLALPDPAIARAHGPARAEHSKAAGSSGHKSTSHTDAEMKARLEKLGPLLDDIGVEAALIAGGKSDGLFLYAEMEGQWASVLVFRDRGKTVKQFTATSRLRELVEQAWILDPKGSRWAALTVAVQGKTFDAQMLYPEQIDRKQPVDERVAALMPKRFDGKKRVADRTRAATDGFDVDETDYGAPDIGDPDIAGRRT